MSYKVYDPFKNYFEKSNVIIDEPPPILTIWWEALSNHPWEPLPSHPPGLFKDPKEPKTTGVGGHPLVCSPHCHMLIVQAHGPYEGVNLLLFSSLGALQAILP